MNNDIITERLKKFNIKSQREGANAVREVTQELALAALSETDFFKTAVFHGGTSLRILYGIKRYSEDLDFALIRKDLSFKWDSYLEQLKEKMAKYGCSLESSDKTRVDTTVQKALIKDSAISQMLDFSWVQRSGTPPKTIIKLEIDNNPPDYGKTINKTLNFPFSHNITTHDMPSQFAGKGSALLTRNYIKGRDWYDFLWYVDNKLEPNYKMLSSCIDQQGPWKDQHKKADRRFFVDELNKKIETLDITPIKADLLKYIDQEEIPKIEELDKQTLFNAVDKFNRYSLKKDQDPDRGR
jgi:predicted nucleotidyltransferase component of viral defense system